MNLSKTDKEFDILFKEKIKNINRKEQKTSLSSLYGKQYFFTEYYNSTSGLVTRFMETAFSDNEEYDIKKDIKLLPVDDFEDKGFIFDMDRQKIIIIEEDSISFDMFGDEFGEKREYIFEFPLFEVFNFLFSLGQRFHGMENNLIIKWPKYIYDKFTELNIKHEICLDYAPKIFDINEHDRDFSEKLGNPEIAFGINEKEFSNTFSTKDDICFYSMKLKLFRPNENYRINKN